VRGEDDVIRSISEGDITAFADFSRFNTKGWHRAPIQIRKEGGALGVEPLEISVNPPEISLMIDWNITKTVPLTIDLRGRTASGFYLVEHTILPNDVVVSGPLDILETISELKTEQVDLQGRNGDFSVIVNIINTNPFVTVRGNGTAELIGIIRPAAY